MNDSSWVKARSLGIQPSEAEIKTEDGVYLRGWFLHRDVSANGRPGVVILLHGQGDNRAGMLNQAAVLFQQGYAVLLPDSRAHGDSGGSLATYGIMERGDISQWVDWIRSRGEAGCIYGLGESMGAAVLLQSFAREKRFCAVVAECPFSSFREIAEDRVGQFFGTGGWLGRSIMWPAVESGFLWAQLRYDLDMESVSPVIAVRNTRTPILLIHGDRDENIAPYHSKELAAQNAAIRLWIVPGAGHTTALQTDSEGFKQRVVSWFREHQNLIE